MSITKPQAEIIADMVPQWEKAMDEIVDALTPCAADFCRHESREHKDSCGCLHPGCECDTFIASSTPAPQDRDYIQYEQLCRMHKTDLIEMLARERESRKQAEDKAFNAGIAMAARVADEMESAASSRLAIGPNFDAHVQFDVAHEISRVIRGLSKPVQEPVEWERGK